MISVSKAQRDELDRFGLLKYKKTGYKAQDPNFVVTNRGHVGRSKHYYVTEEFEIMAFLQQFEKLNLQKITKNQLNTLKDKGLVKDNNIQMPHTYQPQATVYIASDGTIYCKKISQYMKTLNLWA